MLLTKPTRKRIKMSSKRQITIPIEFCRETGAENEVEYIIQNGTLIITPVRQDDGYFDLEIVKDLASQGLTGDEFVQEFIKMKYEKIPQAIKKMLKEAEEYADNKHEFVGLEDIEWGC